MKKDKQNDQARAELQTILRSALEHHADEIILEWGNEGLEVVYVCGNAGTGHVISDDELGEAMLKLMVKEADLDHMDPGILGCSVQGQEQAFEVETSDHFGETAFRLKLVTGSTAKSEE